MVAEQDLTSMKESLEGLLVDKKLHDNPHREA